MPTAAPAIASTRRDPTYSEGDTISREHPPEEHMSEDHLSEAEYLDRESEQAKTAMSASLAEMKQSLASIADPHRLTHDHPWIAVSVAAVAGFATAATLVPSREQQAMRQLVKLQRALRTPVEKAEKTAKADEEKATSWSSKIIGELIKAIRPLLVALVSGLMSGLGKGAADSNDPSLDPADPAQQPGIASPS